MKVSLQSYFQVFNINYRNNAKSIDISDNGRLNMRSTKYIYFRVMNKNYNFAQRSPPNQSKQLYNQLQTIADSKTACASISSSFFDISYIFNDPFAHKNSRKYSKEVKLATQKTAAKNPNRSSNESSHFKYKRQVDMQNPSFMQMDQPPTKAMLNMQKTYLLFDNNGDSQTIHSKRKTTLSSLAYRNNKLLRESQKYSQNNTSLGDGVLTGKGYNNAVDIIMIPKKQKRPQQASQRSNRVSLHKADKHLRLAQRNETPKRYSNKQIDWAKTTMVMRNRQSLRVYRPWSPVHLERQSNIQDQNSLFG